MKKIIGSLRGRILITTTAIGIILLVTSIAVILLAQIQAEQDYLAKKDFLAKKEAIQAYIKARKNIPSYSEEFDYIRH